MKTKNEIRKEFFNQRAEQWLDTFYKDPETGTYSKYHREFKRIFNALGLKAGDHVLDVGCGSGILVPHILKEIGTNGILYELDYAQEMIRENKKLHQDARIKFLVQDLLDLDSSEKTFDAVICFACFPHFEDKRRVMTTLSNVLKRGGVFTIAHLNSSHEINNHHRKSPEVMHDLLPDKKIMYNLCEENNLTINQFVDEEGFYFLLAYKD
jgi:ubiquinone/menaquinone biosynthesis C-methylase UbiE